MSVHSCRLIDLPQFQDVRGDLSFVEGEKHVPFAIRRIYYLYNMSRDAERGAHGHKELEQLIIPIAGAFEIELDDGFERLSIKLNKPYQGLYICPMIWRNLREFTKGAIVLVLASLEYDEDDYFRSYRDFLGAVRSDES